MGGRQPRGLSIHSLIRDAGPPPPARISLGTPRPTRRSACPLRTSGVSRFDFDSCVALKAAWGARCVESTESEPPPPTHPFYAFCLCHWREHWVPALNSPLLSRLESLEPSLSPLLPRGGVFRVRTAQKAQQTPVRSWPRKRCGRGLPAPHSIPGVGETWESRCLHWLIVTSWDTRKCHLGQFFSGRVEGCL